MKPTEFKGQNKIAVGPPDGDILPIPVLNDGRQTITCWLPDEQDKERIAAGLPIWLVIHAGPNVMPMLVTMDKPFEQANHRDAYAICMYTPTLALGGNSTDDVPVYNSVDAAAPMFLKINNRQYKRVTAIPPVFQAVIKLENGEFAIRAARDGETHLGDVVLAQVVSVEEGTWNVYPIK